ncbi:glycosyltransferase family 4 protein [Candidatus Wolfebacteria bacterium]|nr:glycosyltransferase family 4 protein [Candidatus Wolfebacteria bacterium]
MKILFISRSLPYLGGRETIVEQLLKYFSKIDNVFLLTPDSGIKRKNIKQFNSTNSLTKIEAFIKRVKPNIINCHTFYFADLAIYFSKKFNIPLVFTLHGVFIKFYGKNYGNLLKKIYNSSYCVTTVSENYKKNLISFFKLNHNDIKIFCIKNGVDLIGVDKNFDKNALRKNFHLPVNKKIIIIPARLSKLKGINYAVKAAEYFKYNEILFLIASPKGRNMREEKIYKKRLLNQINIKKSIIKFCNYTNKELLILYKICDICLSPSLIEGISIALLEAMSSGLPVIATNVGGNSEIISNKINGFLIKPRNIKDIVTTIKTVLKINSIKLNKIIYNAKRKIKFDFSKKMMLESYRKLFNQVIKNYEN